MNSSLPVAISVFGVTFLALLLFGNGKIGNGRVGILREQPEPQPTEKFIILQKENLTERSWVLTVKDSETNQEYIIVRDYHGISITPRLNPKK